MLQIKVHHREPHTCAVQLRRPLLDTLQSACSRSAQTTNAARRICLCTLQIARPTEAC